MADNWVAKGGGLPPLIKRTAERIAEKNPGWGKSRCIATAVVAIRRMATSGDTNFPGAQQVGPKARAAAQAALAQWERMKAAAGKHRKADLAHVPARRIDLAAGATWDEHRHPRRPNGQFGPGGGGGARIDYTRRTPRRSSSTSGSPAPAADWRAGITGGARARSASQPAPTAPPAPRKRAAPRTAKTAATRPAPAKRAAPAKKATTARAPRKSAATRPDPAPAATPREEPRPDPTPTPPPAPVSVGTRSPSEMTDAEIETEYDALVALGRENRTPEQNARRRDLYEESSDREAAAVAEAGRARRERAQAERYRTNDRIQATNDAFGGQVHVHADDLPDDVLRQRLDDLDAISPAFRQVLTEHLAANPASGIWIGNGDARGLGDLPDRMGARGNGRAAGRAEGVVLNSADGSTIVAVGHNGSGATVSVAAHESGHGIDRALGERAGRQYESSSPGWVRASDAAHLASYRSGYIMSTYYDPNGRAGRGEMFAEGFAAYTLARAAGGDDEAAALAIGRALAVTSPMRPNIPADHATGVGRPLVAYFADLERQLGGGS
ncbi:hypothetical protein ACIBSV_46785 [Embleya sp. NPDC050154]|uniref:hypothetical protein n=1 Tax=Embleya sp. NPDC050154 TaxID=3363988 RepID=UPI003791EB13